MESAWPEPSGSIRFNLIIEPEFPINALILASEALRISNQNTGRDLFSWSFVTLDGKAARASNGMWFHADCSVADMPTADVYLLFCGNLPTQGISGTLLDRLRTANRHGATIGGVDTGTFALVQAGLAGTNREREVVLHWEASPSFTESFPEAHPVDQLYMISGRLLMCAGGVATLDMVLELIANFQDQALANEVANALLHSRREAQTPQRGDRLLTAALGPPLRRLIEIMEKNLESPLSLDALSRSFGMSRRSVARLCARELGQSPMRLYLLLRLRQARNLLFYGDMPVQDVALASGFSSPSVFSRVFKKYFGKGPREFREDFRRRQSLVVLPELRRMISHAQPPQDGGKLRLSPEPDQER